jgi:hypothetical protein
LVNISLSLLPFAEAKKGSLLSLCAHLLRFICI